MDNSERFARRLKATSRSFYLTLRMLPRAIRPQIGLAYLLARTTDTITDTEIVPSIRRLDALQKLRERILGRSFAALDFGELARHQGAPEEKLLLEEVEASLAALQDFSANDQKLIRAVLDTITSGQELDLRRFAGSAGVPPAVCGGSPQTTSIELFNEADGEPTATAREPRALPQVVALQTDGELDDYTYRVAGCVGEFWTRMCLEHVFRLPERVDSTGPAEFEKLGVRFGQGLQLVNILRDLPADLKKGRCYLPVEKLRAAGLSPEALLAPENEGKFFPLFRGYLDGAEANLAAGWEYTNRIPFTCWRLRLACAWPILIGVRTIARLRAAGVAALRQRVKISRGEVRSLLLRSALLYPFPGAWRRQFAAAKAVASGGDLA